jgi:hypothetical protein
MVWQAAGAQNADAALCPAVPFQQIALIGGRFPLQFDLCSGNPGSFYWHLKSMN